jgi:hypothetical protein
LSFGKSLLVTSFAPIAGWTSNRVNNVRSRAVGLQRIATGAFIWGDNKEAITADKAEVMSGFQLE